MSGNHKVLVHSIPYELCTSVQSGLPFVATAYMRFLLAGVLAAAQALYPVTVCHFVVMGNHIHFIIIVQNPEDVVHFMRYFKTEVAHIMNRLLGTTGQSFWVDGYDSVMILSPEKLLERMEYIYLNPVSAGLVRSIEDYPGLNTFPCLASEKVTIQGKKISRDSVEELPHGYLNKRKRAELARQFAEGPGVECELVIEPWAWLKSFSYSREWDIEEVRARFLSRLKEREEKTRKEHVLGAQALEEQDIRKPYKSEREGQKMLCMSHCPEQRKTVIDFLKTQIGYAREAYQRRKRGEKSALPPPGFFLPGGALLANLLPAVLQL